MDTDKSLEKLREEHEEVFKQAMLDQCRHTKEKCGYHPTQVLKMVQQYGPYVAATKIIELPGQSSGFTKLWEHDALGLSVEALVLEQFPWLFPPEIVNTCRETLKAYKKSFVPDNCESPNSRSLPAPMDEQ